MNLLLFCYNWKDSCKSIFWYISFYNYLSIGNLVSENQSEGKCFLKDIECFTAEGVKIPRGILLGQSD